MATTVKPAINYGKDWDAFLLRRTPQLPRCPECDSIEVDRFMAWPDVECIDAWRCDDCGWWELGEPSEPPHGIGCGIYT